MACPGPALAISMGRLGHFNQKLWHKECFFPLRPADHIAAGRLDLLLTWTWVFSLSSAEMYLFEFSSQINYTLLFFTFFLFLCVCISLPVDIFKLYSKLPLNLEVTQVFLFKSWCFWLVRLLFKLPFNFFLNFSLRLCWTISSVFNYV